MQVRAVCYDLGIKDETIVGVYRQIDRLSERGERGLSVFSRFDGLDEEIRLEKIDEVCTGFDEMLVQIGVMAKGGEPLAAMAYEAGMEDNYLLRLRENLRKLYLDPEFREHHWEVYRTQILPQVEEMEGGDSGIKKSVEQIVNDVTENLKNEGLH